ncbi:MAG: glycoside hydrolase family 1 protein [Candidatus Moraniibacteriota bacterium]
MPFPKGFLWGAATAAHQVEGGQHNDWSEWEKQNANRLARESEASFRWNPHWKKFESEATDPANYISGTACDHWNRYREDFDILKSLNLSAYRFSIEWSRIEPEMGKFDEAAIEHYRQMIQALRARGIEPFVTLWHWTLPLWLSKEGGIAAKNFPCYFEYFVEKMVLAFGNDVRFWVTLNEPDVVASHGYLKGAWPPQRRNPILYFAVLRNLIRAHRLAYRTIKNHFPHAEVGIAKHNIWFEAAGSTMWNRLLKKVADQLWNHWFLNKIDAEQDFIGLNHYNHHRIDGWFDQNENKIQTDFGWEYYPESLYHALVELKSYGKPIYVTENGIADASDELRQKFIPAALTAMERAIHDGVDVRGYFYWSLLDNFEWDKGYWLKFGLVAVDRKTQQRTVRPSARVYADLIAKYNTEK